MSKLLLLFAGVALLVPVQPDLPFVPLCELARAPERYAGQRVRTRASYLAHQELPFLYDPACNGEDAYADLALGCEDPEDCRLGQPASRAELLLAGRLADWNGVGYGRDGALRLQFQADQVEAVASVPEAVPGPDRAERQPAPFMQAVRELRALDLALCAALAAGDGEALTKLTLEEFVFTEAGESFTGREHYLESLHPLCPPGSSVVCTTTRVHVHLGMGLTSGIAACDSRTREALSFTHGLRDGAWKGARGQLEHSYEVAAAAMLAQLTALYDDDHDMRELRVEDLPAPYDRDFAELGGTLAGLGLQHLGVLEDLTLASVYPEKPAFLSLFADAEGATNAEAFVLAGRRLVSFMTELDDGRVLLTGQGELDVLDSPPGFEKEVLPLAAPASRVLARHRERLASITREGAHPVEAVSLAQVVDAKIRVFRRVAEHRRSLGYLTRRELEALTASPAIREQVLDLLWGEFRRLVEIRRGTGTDTVPGS